MSHTEKPEPIPPLANIVGRMRWHRDKIGQEPARYDSRELATLRGLAMELATAADRELMKRERP